MPGPFDELLRGLGIDPRVVDHLVQESIPWPTPEQEAALSQRVFETVASLLMLRSTEPGREQYAGEVVDLAQRSPETVVLLLTCALDLLSHAVEQANRLRPKGVG